jgi:iron complex transport system ATP-binding protein
MKNLITCDVVTCGYHRNQRILKGVSFNVGEGEFLGIIGPNGSGKSTLLRAMSGCLAPLDGSIFYGGANLYEVPKLRIAKDFAFVSQDTVFSFSFTSWEIVLMGRIPYLARLQQETSRDFEIAKESMQLTDTLRLRDRQVNELSAGERQMVVIAKALAQSPKVLFLDEPTSHLDIGHQVQILKLLSELNTRKNITIIIVLHDLNLASEYCDRLLLLNNGSVFRSGNPEEVLTYQNIEEVYKTLVLVNKNPISGHPHVLLINKRS